MSPLPAPLHWREWPLRDHPLRAAAVVAAMLAAGLIIAWTSGQAHLAWFGVAALAIAMWQFFVPVDYDLGPGGVGLSQFGRRRRLAWLSIRGYEVCPQGVLLLPCEAPCLADVPAGVFLAWSWRRDEVLAHVRLYLGQSWEDASNGPLRDSLP